MLNNARVKYLRLLNKIFYHIISYVLNLYVNFDKLIGVYMS